MFVTVIGREDEQNSNIGKQRCAYSRRNIELPAAARNLIPHSRFPQGESRGRVKGSPTPATRSAPANNAGTAHAAAPPARGAFAPLAPSPDQSQPTCLKARAITPGEKNKDGRHVGLDFYDLLIDAV